MATMSVLGQLYDVATDGSVAFQKWWVCARCPLVQRVFFGDTNKVSGTIHNFCKWRTKKMSPVELSGAIPCRGKAAMRKSLSD